MTSSPKKKIALVTGGARGIGLGISKALAREGFDLVLCGVKPAEVVQGVLSDLSDSSDPSDNKPSVHYVQADISIPADRARLLAETRRLCGALHVLVNNAGVAPLQRLDILEATEESFERVMRINLQGPYFLTQAAANWMLEQKRAAPEFSGAIINVSSVSATMASPSRGEYCVSKAGVSMATQLFAVRLAEHGIPVYEVRPGITATDMTSGVKEKYDKLIAEGLVPQRRWGQPEDVGRAVAMLARGDLPYSTGQVVMVDGGVTLARL